MAGKNRTFTEDAELKKKKQEKKKKPASKSKALGHKKVIKPVKKTSPSSGKNTGSAPQKKRKKKNTSPYPEIRRKKSKPAVKIGNSRSIEYSDERDASDRGDMPMSLVDHLEEFRTRFLISLITIVVLTIVGLIFSYRLVAFITEPYLAIGLELNILHLIDPFLLHLKTAFVAAVLVGFPVIAYEAWKYVVPAISKKDRMFSRLSLVAAVLLFYTGAYLTYLALPMVIKALLNFTPEYMKNTISAANYLSFVLIFILGIGLVFELPIVIMILTKIGIMTPGFLVSKRKYAIVLIWILAAIITPTVDPLTQSAVAIPLMLLYEISIFISRFVLIRKAKKDHLDLK